MSKTILLYLIILLIFGAGIFLILNLGTRLQSDRNLPEQSKVSSIDPIPLQPQAPKGPSNNIVRALQENLRHPLSVLLLQVISILVVAKLVGTIFHKLGQPYVVGEMIAGILLGPSLLGWLSPSTMDFLFPPSTIQPLGLLSQIGIILFMFSVGLKLNLQNIRHQAHAVVLISHASIIFPFFLGATFSLLVFRSFAPYHISFIAFALFISVAMSITAFPVLARILEERELSKSNLGSTVMACAAVDDVTAWCLLAVVIAIVKAHGLDSAMLTILLTLLYIMVMLWGVKPRSDRLILKGVKDEIRGNGLVVGLLIFVFTSALFTEIIGVHALFGAFLAGVILPRNLNLRIFLLERLEIFIASFLLPLFFAFTGVRTQIGLLDDWSSWFACVGVIVVAIAGKLGGSMLAARWTGMNWHDSISLGVLMNTRGLMELIVLNIGLDLGIITSKVFSMMILMALATTIMTGPILSLLGFWKFRETAFIDRSGAAILASEQD